MAEDRESLQAIDPEAQKTADLVSKLMTDLTDEGREPSDQERMGRLFQAEHDINTQISQIRNSGRDVPESLYHRLDTLGYIRSGIKRAVRARVSRNREVERVDQEFRKRLEDNPEIKADLLRRADIARGKFRKRGGPSTRLGDPPAQIPPSDSSSK